MYNKIWLRELPLREHLKYLIRDEVIDFIFQYVDVESGRTYFTETGSLFNISILNGTRFSALVNLKLVNDIRYINKFFQAINDKLEMDGYFIGRFESIEQRYKRKINKFPKPVSYPFYFLDFIINRVFPRLRYLKRLYFYVTKGTSRALPLAEILGRLISCGFQIVEYRNINDYIYFVVKKTGRPDENLNPSYGPLFTMRRIGKGGKIVRVYKFRTMHPYSEYLQKYIFEQNKLQEGGKIKNDFRVTKWGRIMRKMWLDELPMIINMLRGELKIVGVRPLSEHYLSLYPAEFRQRRVKYTPGLVPPFYVHLPKTFDEIIKSEEAYLDEFDKHPFLTDIKYFIKAFINIVLKGARSA
ncbi:MAG: sugar transferase [Ignavibacteria bacterium]|nr:sugar transferase [Ignavibacteria bacterium]